MVIDKKVLMGASAAAALLFSGPSYSQEVNSVLPYVMEDGERTDDLQKALDSWSNSKAFNNDRTKSNLKLHYAYALGLTGAGVTLGIVDTGIQRLNPLFAREGKLRGVDEGNTSEYGQFGLVNDRFALEIHGDHVASTMAGDKGVKRMPTYGVAFGSNVVSAVANLYLHDVKWIRDDNFGTPIVEPLSLLKKMLEQYPDVKIINNSWGSALDFEYDDEDIDAIKKIVADDLKGTGAGLDFLRDKDTVFVWAAGNIYEEEFSPHASKLASIGLLDEKLRNKWVSVVNVDSFDDAYGSYLCGHTATYCVSAIGEDVAAGVVLYANEKATSEAFWKASDYAELWADLRVLSRQALDAIGSGEEEYLRAKHILSLRSEIEVARLKLELYDGLTHENAVSKVTNFFAEFGYILRLVSMNEIFDLEFFDYMDLDYLDEIYDSVIDPLKEEGYQFTKEDEFAFLTATGDTIDYIRTSLWSYRDTDIVQLSGTSMAAPTISGFLGLLSEYSPEYSAELLADIMFSSSRDIGEEGVDLEYGWGIPQMDIALGGPTALRGVRDVSVAAGTVDTWKHGIQDAKNLYTKPVLKNFSNDIGGINKIGGGELILLGNNTYTGPTTVSGGFLTVEGAIRNSNVQVNSGGMLSGTGQIFSLTATKDSVVAPGTFSAPYGTLTVLKDADFQTGSNLWVRVNPETQEYSKLNVLGSSNVSGLNVIVKANEGLWRLRTNMIVLSANGGIKGTVEGIKTDLAFLDPFVSYNANSVIVSLVRNDVKFEEFVSNENDKIVARTLDNTFDPNSTNLQIVDFIMDTDHQTIRNLLPQLSGNLHANLASVASMEDRVIRNAMLGRTKSNSTQQNMIDKNLYAWAAVHAGDGAYDYSRHNKFEVRSTGLSAGLDYITDSAQFGVAISENKSKLERAYFSNNSSVKNTSIGVYGATNLQGFNLVVGSSISMLDFDANRTVSANSLSEKLMSDYSGDGWQVFGELSWPTVMLSANIDPYINYSYGTLEADFAENDKVAAMRGSVSSENHAVTIGLRGLKNITTPNRSSSIVSLVGDLSLTSNLNDDGTELRARIENSPEFVLKHEPIYKNAINAGVFINLQATNWAAFDVGYNGTYSDTYTDNRLFGRVTVKF